MGQNVEQANPWRVRLEHMDGEADHLIVWGLEHDAKVVACARWGMPYDERNSAVTAVLAQASELERLKVMQLNHHAHSQNEALMACESLRIQDGCIEAHTYGLAVGAHFEMPQNVAEEAMPEGCRIVPASIVTFLKRRGPQASNLAVILGEIKVEELTANFPVEAKE